jgi:hypothetical protein
MARRFLFLAAALAVLARLTIYVHGGLANTVCMIVFGVCAAGWAVSEIVS